MRSPHWSLHQRQIVLFPGDHARNWTFHLGNVYSQHCVINSVTQRSISDNPRTPIKVTRCDPDTRLGQPRRRNGSVTVGYEILHTVTTFGGHISGDGLKTTWTWKADDGCAYGLDGRTDFWVTIPPAENGVEAVFKLTFRVRKAKRRPHKKAREQEPFICLSFT